MLSERREYDFWSCERLYPSVILYVHFSVYPEHHGRLWTLTHALHWTNELKQCTHRQNTIPSHVCSILVTVNSAYVLHNDVPCALIPSIPNLRFRGWLGCFFHDLAFSRSCFAWDPINSTPRGLPRFYIFLASVIPEVNLGLDVNQKSVHSHHSLAYSTSPPPRGSRLSQVSTPLPD